MEEAIDGAMTRRFELEWAPFWTGTSYFAPYLPVGTTLSLLEVAMLSGSAAARGLSDTKSHHHVRLSRIVIRSSGVACD